MAEAWDELMHALGYARYGAHGGDAGALISRELGILKPDGLVGVHVLQIFAFPSGDPAEMEGLSDFDMEALQILSGFEDRAGYLKIQQTRPQTLAYGSPTLRPASSPGTASCSWDSAARAWAWSIATGSSLT